MSLLSPHSSTIHLGLRRPTCCGAQLLVGGMAAALIAFFFISSMGASVATAPIEAAPAQIVVRTHKGNRLLGASATQNNVPRNSREVTTPQQPAVDLELPEGCDPLVNPVADDLFSQVAVRCVT